MITDRDIFLDFETRSRAKLTGKDSVGAWRYAEDESTSVLSLSYAFGEREPQLWTPGLQCPKILGQAIEKGFGIHGWNSMSFERAIFEIIMGPKYGWPTPKLEQYHDTMLDALALALPAALGNCGKALGLSVQKDKEGKRLLNYLCKPIASGKKKGEFRERENFAKEYAALYLYNKQDVRAERAIYEHLPYHLEGRERGIALLFVKMNERGLPVDLTEVMSIDKGINLEKGILLEAFHTLTGLNSPTQTEKFLVWMNANLKSVGLTQLNMQKETLRDLVKDYRDRIPANVLNAVLLSMSIKRTSNAKYKKILAMVCKDGTVKNNLIPFKANTGRAAGSGFQCQNLPQLCESEPEPIINAFIDEDYGFLRAWRGVLESASALIRSVVKAPAGYKFINGDLKGVEARGACWVAGEWALLEKIKKGFGIYEATAADMYNVDTSECGKGTDYRDSGKISVLSGQFGGGWRAQIKMSVKLGMELTDFQARRNTQLFRRGRPKLVQKWADFRDAAMKAITDPGLLFPVDSTHRYSFIRLGDFLYMVLPNKRMLSFPFPRIEAEDFYGNMVENVTAMWNDKGQWVRRKLTGANLFQSAVQATCCDLLMDSHIRIENDGMPVNLSVHDEGMSIVPDDKRYTKKRYEELMCIAPEWAVGFPIGADCWEGRRFRK